MSSVVVTCAGCGANNRKMLARLAEQPVCAKCARVLPRGGGPVALDDGSFDTVARASPVPLLVDFWATWCGPCTAFAPVLERYAAAHQDDLLVVKVDTDASPALARRHAIQAIPTIALFRGGTEVARQAGAMPPAALAEWVAGALGTR